MRSSRFRARGGVAIAWIALCSSGCGISSNSGFDPIDQADSPLLTTPSTVVSTTTTTTTSPANTSTAPDVGPGVHSTVPSTTNAVAVEAVTLYFATTSLADPKLTSETRMLSKPATLARVVSALVDGPQPGSGAGLQTSVPEGLVVEVEERRGVARVELDFEVMSELLTPPQQRLAIGQLVLTLGVRPGVGQVQFTRDGKPYPVSVPSRNGQTGRQPVANDDFQSMTETDLAPVGGMEPT